MHAQPSLTHPVPDHSRRPPSAALLPLFADYLADHQHEHVIVAGFDSRGCLRDFREQCGDATQVEDILPLFRAILAQGAVTEIILAHSHPGASAIPSHQDRLTTQRLSALARLAGALLLDHVIIGNDGVFSLSDEAHIA
jgi:DNA repair protein RadC